MSEIHKRQAYALRTEKYKRYINILLLLLLLLLFIMLAKRLKYFVAAKKR